jgi:hypothetical protein
MSISGKSVSYLLPLALQVRIFKLYPFFIEGGFMNKTRILIFLILFLGLSISANATIISTEVAVSMKIEYGAVPLTLDISGSDSGATQADVYLTGPTTGIDVWSDLGLNYLTDEEAILDFTIGWDATGYSGRGYKGEDGSRSNYAKIEYSAAVDSEMTYEWDFAYSGSNPFGLQIIQVLSDGSELQKLGDVGNVGVHQGSDIFNLMAGNNYTFQVLFHPNIYGGIGGLGELAGNVSFDFNGGAAPVPEPATLLLLGSGVVALAGFGRKKFLKKN